MTDLRQQFLKEFGDGGWHELEDVEILFSLSLTNPLDPDTLSLTNPLDPDTLLQAIERGGIVLERGPVINDLGAPDDISGEWHEDLTSTPGFRVIEK